MCTQLIRVGLIVIALCGFCPEIAVADSYLPDSDLIVEAIKSEKLIQISATFSLPLTQCESYRFLTDYNIQKDLPGFIYSNPTRLSPTKVRIEREVEERVLFIPVHLSSTIEVNESTEARSTTKEVGASNLALVRLRSSTVDRQIPAL